MFQYHQVHYNNSEKVDKVNTTNFNGTYILDNLEPYTKYSVYVTAVRLIGSTGRSLEGKKSETVTGRTLAGGTVFIILNKIYICKYLQHQ